MTVSKKLTGIATEAGKAPLIGALGSFISGSATFSNMMFSLFQFSVADQIGVDQQSVLSLQVLGANAGNLVCVLNVVAAASVVHLSGREDHPDNRCSHVAICFVIREYWSTCSLFLIKKA
ncbi:MAG: L-lactate permease [Bacillota bacterium]